MMRRLLRITAFKVAFAVGVLFSVAHFARRQGHFQLFLLERLEWKALDYKFTLRGALPLTHKVALAEIDEKAVQAHGLWPWNRALIAQSIDKLFDAGAAAVALDMVVADPDRNSSYATLAELKKKLGAPDPGESAKLQALLAKPPSAEVEAALKAALDEHQRLADEAGALERAVAQPPDEALRATIERHKDDLVLGVIGADAKSNQQFSPEVIAAWEREVSASLLPHGFRLKDTPRGPQPQGVPDRKWFVPQDAVIEAWLPEIAGEGRYFGAFSLEPDADGTLRRYEPVKGHGAGFYPSLALAAVARMQHGSLYPIVSDFTPGGVDGAAALLDDGLVQAPGDAADLGRMLVNYVGPKSAWASASEHGADGQPACKGALCDRVSLADVLAGTVDPAVVKDKLVFLSVTALGTFDQRVTPFEPFVPGVYVHMNVAEDMLGKRFIANHDWFVVIEVGILLGLAIFLGLLLPRVGHVAQLAILPVTLGGYFAANVYAFAHGTQLSTVTPLLEIVTVTFAIVFFQYMTSDKEKRQIRNAFQYYLTESVMTEMLQDPSKLKLGGEKRNLTVMFSDIRGFTTLSEMLEASEVARTLNEYLTPMTGLVFEEGGTLDKYMGDAIMAFWGAPSTQPDHALRACRTAVRMIEALDVMRAEWKAKGRPDIDIGIGLNSGLIHVGNMGSDSRFDYTVIGDDVNLASRLEGTNKSYGTRVIIGENTYREVRGQVVARELGGVMVKGKKKPVTIYELRKMGAPNAEDQAGIDAFVGGLVAYRARDWDGAEAAFHACQKIWPGDGPSEKYLDDIADKRTHPPDEGWDGVYVMKTK